MHSNNTHKRNCLVPGLLVFVISTGACTMAQTEGNSDSAVNCDRACVIDRVETYVDALVRHQAPSSLLADNLRSTENGGDMLTGQGLWQSITKRESYSQVFVDQGNQSAVFFGAFSEGPDPLLLAIRFRFQDGLITELEHLASRPDYRNSLINRHRLTQPNPVFEELLPEPDRVDRDVLITVANLYFDGIQNSNDQSVPMHRNCIRRENGVILLKNDNPESQPCPLGFRRFNYITGVRDRRTAIVDEERGLVLAWAFFDVPGNIEVEPRTTGPSDLTPASGEPRVDTRKIPRSLYIAELFKVVGGKIRDIDAIMYNMDLGSRSGWE